MWYLGIGLLLGLSFPHFGYALDDLRGRDLRASLYIGDDLRSEDFTDSNISAGRFYDCDLRGTVFKNAITEGTSFVGSRYDSTTILPFTRDHASARGMQFILANGKTEPWWNRLGEKPIDRLITMEGWVVRSTMVHYTTEWGSDGHDLSFEPKYKKRFLVRLLGRAPKELKVEFENEWVLVDSDSGKFEIELPRGKLSGIVMNNYLVIDNWEDWVSKRRRNNKSTNTSLIGLMSSQLND